MENYNKNTKTLGRLRNFCINYIASVSEIWDLKNTLHFVYPMGTPMIPHLPRCQVLAVDYYGFALGRLGPAASSTFAQSGKE